MRNKESNRTARGMTFQDKKDAITNFGIEEVDLDRLIHDVKSDEACGINNDGLDAQLTYLFQRGWTVEAINFWRSES